MSFYVAAEGRFDYIRADLHDATHRPGDVLRRVGDVRRIIQIARIDVAHDGQFQARRFSHSFRHST